MCIKNYLIPLILCICHHFIIIRDHILKLTRSHSDGITFSLFPSFLHPLFLLLLLLLLLPVFTYSFTIRMRIIIRHCKINKGVIELFLLYIYIMKVKGAGVLGLFNLLPGEFSSARSLAPGVNSSSEEESERDTPKCSLMLAGSMILKREGRLEERRLLLLAGPVEKEK